MDYLVFSMDVPVGKRVQVGRSVGSSRPRLSHSVDGLTTPMAGKPWSDGKDVEMRLQAHRFAGLQSIDLEGRESIGAIGAVLVDSSDRARCFVTR